MYEGLDLPNQKIVWTSAGEPSGSLPYPLCGIRPTVLSLLRATIPYKGKTASLKRETGGRLRTPQTATVLGGHEVRPPEAVRSGR